jgi:uncharacterized cupredoxin-like copper-binding protein
MSRASLDAIGDIYSHRRFILKNVDLKKHLATVVLAIGLPILSPMALASGSHGGGHDQAKIDYSEAEEHEFGKAGDPAKATKTIEIDMSDGLRFSPSDMTVKRGETVKFVVRNGGKLRHEMVLGTDDSLHEHAKLMMKFPGMEHDEPHMAHVAPGESSVMGWQFMKAGTFHFGCLVPGHYEGGMKGTITVQ